jgi:hypothetical protein
MRQLRDWKMSAVIEEMIPQGMKLYAWLCGWTLARAHARSGDRIAIAAYLGNSTKFDNAIADFAETYADQNLSRAPRRMPAYVQCHFLLSLWPRCSSGRYGRALRLRPLPRHGRTAGTYSPSRMAGR